VIYAPNIHNNLISINCLSKKGLKLLMEMCNNKEILQILRNNKLITITCANVENLFTINTNLVNDIDYNINNVDLTLKHAKLSHYYN